MLATLPASKRNSGPRNRAVYALTAGKRIPSGDIGRLAAKSQALNTKDGTEARLGDSAVEERRNLEATARGIVGRPIDEAP